VLMVPVEGSNVISAYGWEPQGRVNPRRGDPVTGVFAVEFVRGGTWHYLDVPERVLEDFLLAHSRGAFFLHNIRGKYPEVQIE